MLYLQIFYVHTPRDSVSSVHGFVFTPSQKTSAVQQAFQKAKVLLKHIPSYQPNHFFGILQNKVLSHPLSHDWPRVHGCRKQLMDHQVQAVHFIQRCESSLVSIPEEIWNHSDNEWVRDVFQDAVRQGFFDGELWLDSRGCILADDMGLGKTLKTLSAIQLSIFAARQFPNQRSDHENGLRTSATLIICPLSTLENWKNEIKQSFSDGSFPFLTFYGKEKNSIEFQDITRVAVVLATYNSISIPNQSHNNQGTSRSQGSQGRPIALDWMNIEWFRIVLDEAQWVRLKSIDELYIILKFLWFHAKLHEGSQNKP